VPYLGDYLGQLMSELAMARMQADLETVRLAELYAAHPLLRTMPVPHLRLPNVDLDVPVLVKQSQAPRPGESPRGGARLDALRAKFEEVLDRHLGGAAALTPVEKTRLRASLDERIRATPAETAVDVHKLADDFLERAAQSVGAKHPTLRDELRDKVRLEFLKLRSAPPRLDALVTSSELREAGTPDNIVRVRLKISEEGVEWSSVEVDGVRQDRLIPE